MVQYIYIYIYIYILHHVSQDSRLYKVLRFPYNQCKLNRLITILITHIFDNMTYL